MKKDLFHRYLHTFRLLVFNLRESLHHARSQQDIELIKQTELFHQMSEKNFQNLLESIRYTQYPESTLIIREKETADALYIIVEGSVRVFTYDAEGKKIPLARLNKGDYFGEQGLIGQANKTRNASIETITPTTLIKINEKYLASVLQTDMALKRKLKKKGIEEALNILNLSTGLHEQIKAIIAGIENPEIVEYPIKKVIFSEGDRPDHAYLILQGEVEILLSDKKGNFISVLSHRGQLFGELGVIKNQPRTGTAIAHQSSRLLMVSNQYLKNHLQQHPQLQKIFANLWRVYQLPAQGTVEQYIGRTPELGEQLTSLFKMKDGRSIISSTFLNQDIFVIAAENTTWDKLVQHTKGPNKIELFMQGKQLVSIKSWGWWDNLSSLCRILFDNTPISETELLSFEKTGELVVVPAHPAPEISRQIICDCMSVSKLSLVESINQGARTLDELSQQTGACTICRCCKYRILELLGENPWVSAIMRRSIIHNSEMQSFLLKAIDSHFTSHWQAGQHVVIQAKMDDQWVERTYTLSDLTSDPLRITIKKEPKGLFTRWLFETAPDEFRVNATHPQGDFLLNMNTQTAALCLAGGIGITPFVAYAKALAKQHVAKKMHIIYCASHKTDFILQDEFQQITTETPTVTIHYQATREAGRLTPEMILKTAASLSEPDIYICGSEGFVNMVLQALKDYPQDKIHNEKFTHAGG